LLNSLCTNFEIERLTMSKIKYGQIGVGHAHASKMSVFRESPDYEVVGIVEPDPHLRKQAESQPAYNGVPWMTQEQLLNVPGLQVVGVETLVKDLLDTAETCVNAGMHIHLDKPAGESLPQFKRILDTAASKHLLVQMGYMYRYSPAVLMLRDFLKKGWLGEPFEVHTVMSKVVDATGRKRMSVYRGGIMFELGCHILDLTQVVLGVPEKVTGHRQHIAPLDDQFLDNMLAVLEYPKAIATVKSSAIEVEGFARRHFVVCGTEGTFHIQPLDAPSVRFAFSKPRDQYKASYQEVTFGDYRRYVGDAADIAKVVRNEKSADLSYDHDFEVQKSVLLASGLPLDV